MVTDVSLKKSLHFLVTHTCGLCCDMYYHIHTVRKWIYIRHKLPRTFDSSLSIYDINAYEKCLEKLIWTKKKNHVPQRHQ